MQVILLERIDKLGALGDVVKVRDGYARNFLLPQGKALRATDANKARFDREKDALEKINAERRDAAASVAGDLDGQTFTLIRSAGESGQLYGSVAARDVVEAAEAAGFKIARAQVSLDKPIKSVGLHEVKVRLHAEVVVTVRVNVARSPDEAERQARGEDVIQAMADEDRAIAEAQAADLGGALLEAGPSDEG